MRDPLLSLKTPQGYITAFTYDSYGNVTSFTDAQGNVTSLGYDTQYHAYLTSITDPLNHTISGTYDLSTGLVTSTTDAKGYTTSFQYDLLGRVTKKINPDQTEKEVVYDDQNNTAAIYDELDHKTIMYYDGLNRLTKTECYINDTLFLAETFTYNYLSKLETKTDPGGHVYTYEYDSLRRIVRLTNPDSSFKQIQYDDTSATVSTLDENSHKKEYHYDWKGRLLWVREYTDPSSYHLTQYTYDSSDHLTSFTDARGNTTSYAYDSLSGVTMITYPDSSVETFTYDALGNMVQRTDARGTTTFTYDALSQLTGVYYPDQSAITFAYDVNGNRIVMTDPQGQTISVYDSRNRPISETRTINGESYTVTYGYDAASRITSLTYPDLSVVTYEYDPLNRVTSIPGYAEFTYDAESLLSTATFGNGITTDYQYNSCHRPTSIHAQKNGTDLLLMGYAYDPAGNVSYVGYQRMVIDQWVQSAETYGYDWLDRLVSVQGSGGSVTYSYDPVGNRLSQGDVTYVYNAVNELLSVSDGTQFTYDGVGNTLTRTKGEDTWSYTYDARNQLTQAEKNQQILGQYVYDGGGRRIEKTEWVEPLQTYHTTVYVYSGSNVIYEKNVATGKEATHVYGPTGRIAKTVDELRNYYHTDHLGSTRLVTDESGNVVTEASYTPFGEAATTGEEESYLFTGKEKDATSLYYFGARYYDPETGRFLTRDAFAGKKSVPQTLNRYSYCMNNPLRYVDPWGHSADDFEDLYAPYSGGSYTITGEKLEEYVANLVDFLRQFLLFGTLSINGHTFTIWDYINSLIRDGQYLLAVLCILIMQGYADDITSITFNNDGTGVICLNINDTEVVITVGGESGGDNGKTTPPGKEGDTVYVNIYKDAFFNNGEPCAQKLWHVVGHEMVHANHMVKGGLYWGWYYYYKQKGLDEASARDMAAYMSEMLAWQWDITHFADVPYDGGLETALAMWNKYSEIVEAAFRVWGKP